MRAAQNRTPRSIIRPRRRLARNPHRLEIVRLLENLDFQPSPTPELTAQVTAVFD